MKERYPLSFGTVSVLQKGGSLQITVPSDVAKLMELRVGAEVRIGFDPVTREMIVSRDHTRIVTRREAETLISLQKAGVYLPRRHYELSSGRHSPDYAHIRLALAYEDYAKQIGQAIIELLDDEEKINAVAGFTVGGILLAEAISKKLNARLIVGEKKRRNNVVSVVFYNLDGIRKDEKILLVDDILTTGGSLRLAINTIESKSENLIAIAVVVDRSQETTIDLGFNVLRLTAIRFTEHDPETCPLCKEGTPLINLGNAEFDEKVVLDSLHEDKRQVMVKAYRHVQKLMDQAKSKMTQNKK